MAVRRINAAVRRLQSDWSQVKNMLSPPDGSDGAPFELCKASRDNWRRYVHSEEQVSKSHRMVWYEGRILIVELGEGFHESVRLEIAMAIYKATGTDDKHLVPHGATCIGYSIGTSCRPI
ncbi:hypothetical protein V7S43_010711 [Phytophthora oleae]|uniref:Uncharacterized protein n=1 Tax=Phytophthora oleae TaxID=2107226 RepID=A0ABD3FC89_9STRA